MILGATCSLGGLVHIFASICNVSKGLAIGITVGTLCLALLSSGLFVIDANELLTDSHSCSSHSSQNYPPVFTVNPKLSRYSAGALAIKYKHIGEKGNVKESPEADNRAQPVFIDTSHGQRQQVYDPEDEEDSTSDNEAVIISLKPPFFRKGGFIHILVLAFLLVRLLPWLYEACSIQLVLSQPASTIKFWLAYHRLLF